MKFSLKEKTKNKTWYKNHITDLWQSEISNVSQKLAMTDRRTDRRIDRRAEKATFRGTSFRSAQECFKSPKWVRVAEGGHIGGKQVCFKMHFRQNKVFEDTFFLMENRVLEDPPSQLNGKFH